MLFLNSQKEVTSRRSLHQLFNSSQPEVQSPVTTTTTTTTFRHWPTGQPTTRTTVTTSKNGQEETTEGEESTNTTEVLNTSASPNSTAVTSCSPAADELLLDTLTLATQAGTRRLSGVSASELPRGSFSRPKLFSFLNDSPSFFGLQEEDGEGGGQSLANFTFDEPLLNSKNDKDLITNIITPEDEEDDPKIEDEVSSPLQPKNSSISTPTEELSAETSTSSSTPSFEGHHHQTSSLLKRAKINARFFGELCRKLRPLENPRVTRLRLRGLAKWKKVVDMFCLKIEDTFEQLVAKSL